MKIGILTFHFVYNYGAMLQAYAMKTYLTEIGNEVEIIDYRPTKINDSYRSGIKSWLKSPVKQLKRNIKLKISKTKFESFETFIYQYLVENKHYNNKEIMNALNSKDIVIVGSDQIWNFSITGEDWTYFLSNIKSEVKRVAYAASCGNYIFEEKHKMLIKEELKKFYAISVREKSLKEKLKIISKDLKIESVPDPVFLINKEKWNEMLQEVKVPKKYILFYSLNKTSGLIEYALQANKNIPVIAIHPLYRFREFSINRTDIGPKEFLWLIKHAEFVVTDSFHATAFSIIFNKKIVVDRSMDRGGRIQNIFEELQIEEIKEINGLSIIEENCCELIEKYGEVGKKFLNKC